jgi:hypothetical protein
MIDVVIIIVVLFAINIDKGKKKSRYKYCWLSHLKRECTRYQVPGTGILPELFKTLLQIKKWKIS